MRNPRLMTIIGLIFAAAASRLIPHQPNMTSITAVALFGGAYFSDRRLAFLVPFAALLLSDFILGSYDHMEIVYLSFALVVCVGHWLQMRRSILYIVGAALASSVLFFLLTNFGVWALESLYPKTIAGLVACYVAAIPFFENQIQSDLFYTLLLFGGFRLLESQFSTLRDPRVAPDTLSA